MATISSHVLDSVVGDHACGIRIACVQIAGGGRHVLFDTIADEQGRIVERVAIDGAPNSATYELIFHTAAYFATRPNMPHARQIMNEVVVRIEIPEPDERIHIPLVLSPHSYTIWWSA